ncbi:MAG: hypothetical protein AAGA06_00795 [Pseudomonadota bacterium]
MPADFDICIVAQKGRLSFEAVLFAATLCAAAPGFEGRLIVGEPQPGPLWRKDPRIDTDARALLTTLGAEILPFTSHHFGDAYPYGNKVEMLAAMPKDRPFLFFDTDTIITGPVDRLTLDFDRPAASMMRENTWPVVPLYGPDLGTIWSAVYRRAGVEMAPTLDLSQPEGHWERHLYFNAGWFFYRCPQVFAAKMIDLMVSLRDDRPDALACQTLDPWLDQIALPAVIAGLGGGRPEGDALALDGEMALHWRALPLLYAKTPDATVEFLETTVAPNKIKKVLKQYEPFKRMIYQGRGARVRALFDQTNLPPAEKAIRNRIRREKLWMR